MDLRSTALAVGSRTATTFPIASEDGTREPVRTCMDLLLQGLRLEADGRSANDFRRGARYLAPLLPALPICCLGVQAVGGPRHEPG